MVAIPASQQELRHPATAVTLFLMFLRDRDHAITHLESEQASHLLKALAKEKRVPEKFEELAQWLKPIVCKSPSQQAYFGNHVAAFLRTFRQTSTTPTEPAPKAIKQRRNSLRLFILLAILAFSLWFKHASGSDLFSLMGTPVTNTKTPPVVLISTGTALLSLSLTAVIFSTIVIFILFVQGYFLRRFLKKQPLSHAQIEHNLQLQKAVAPAWDLNQLGKIGYLLGSQKRIIQQGFDLIDSIRKTALAGGCFTPVPGSKKVAKDYLVLTETPAQRDHFFHLIAEMLADLEQAGMTVHRWQFQGDPRFCFNSEGHHSSLEDLAQAFPHAVFWLFSDGRRLFDPISQAPQPWLHQFQAWPQRVLFTHDLSHDWRLGIGKRLNRIFRVLPLTASGLSWSVQDSQLSREQVAEDCAAIPRTFRENSLLWLINEAPDSDFIEEGLDALYAYLGSDGYLWLAGCAVFPALHWHITLFMGQKLHPFQDKALQHQLLLKLTHLPWFRQGAMPNWLRQRLLQDLDAQTQQAIRVMLSDNFADAPKQDHATLPIERHAEAETSPTETTRDRLTLGFIQSRLSFTIPAAIARLLGKKKRILSLKNSLLEQVNLRRNLRLLIFVILIEMLAVRGFRFLLQEAVTFPDRSIRLQLLENLSFFTCVAYVVVGQWRDLALDFRFVLNLGLLFIASACFLLFTLGGLSITLALLTIGLGFFRAGFYSAFSLSLKDQPKGAHTTWFLVLFLGFRLANLIDDALLGPVVNLVGSTMASWLYGLLALLSLIVFKGFNQSIKLVRQLSLKSKLSTAFAGLLVALVMAPFFSQNFEANVYAAIGMLFLFAFLSLALRHGWNKKDAALFLIYFGFTFFYFVFNSRIAWLPGAFGAHKTSEMNIIESLLPIILIIAYFVRIIWRARHRSDDLHTARDFFIGFVFSALGLGIILLSRYFGTFSETEIVIGYLFSRISQVFILIAGYAWLSAHVPRSLIATGFGLWAWAAFSAARIWPRPSALEDRHAYAGEIFIALGLLLISFFWWQTVVLQRLKEKLRDHKAAGEAV